MKFYISDAKNSTGLSEAFHPLVQKEECYFEEHFLKEYLKPENKNIRPDLYESYLNGYDKEDYIYNSYLDERLQTKWKSKGVRYFIEFNRLEELIEWAAQIGPDIILGDFTERFGFPRINTKETPSLLIYNDYLE